MGRSRTVDAIRLKVIEAKHRDLAKYRARLPASIMGKLGIKDGDIVEIVGKQSTAAIALSLDEEDEQSAQIIRLDWLTRRNAGLSLNDYAIVRKAQTKVAKSVKLTPIDAKLVVDEAFSEFVKNRLKGMPLADGRVLAL